MHFTPTHASWLNQVEGSEFSILSDYQQTQAHLSLLRPRVGGGHLRLPRNLDKDLPKLLKSPFMWVKTADEILAKVAPSLAPKR